MGDQKRYVARSFEPGEPILEGKLSNSSRNGDIPPGMRIVSIPIDVVSGVSGFVGAGDRVDILLTRSDEGKLVNQVVLENILVHAVDQRSDTERATPRTGRTVTVVVTIRDAQLLNVALAVGDLSLTLRGENDTGDMIAGVILAAKPAVTSDDLNDFREPIAAPEKFIWMRKGGVLEKVLIK